MNRRIFGGSKANRDRRNTLPPEVPETPREPVEEPMPMTVTIHTLSPQVADELRTAFYECPLCGFERVPHVATPTGRQVNYTDKYITARYCPGCGRLIHWAL